MLLYDFVMSSYSKLHFQVEWGWPIISAILVISSSYVHVDTALALHIHYTNVLLESIALLCDLTFFKSHTQKKVM